MFEFFTTPKFSQKKLVLTCGKFCGLMISRARGRHSLWYHFKELCAIFPAYQSAIVCMLNGIFDGSAGVLLFFKIAYDAIAGITLKNMLIVYAIGSSIIWIKTFFLSSYHSARLNTDKTFSVFKDSPVGRLCCNRKSIKISSYWVHTFFKTPISLGLTAGLTSGLISGLTPLGLQFSEI